MRKYLLFVILLGFSAFAYAQSSHRMAKSTIKPLTATDRKNYVLMIDQGKVSKSKYSLPKNNYYGKTVLFVPVKLTNSSNDTLKYITMSCSWEEFYTTDNQHTAIIPGKPCEKNIPKELAIAPHAGVMVKVPVIKIQHAKKFRIGMALIKLDRGNDLGYFFDVDWIGFLNRDKERNNVIWSNPIELP